MVAQPKTEFEGISKMNIFNLIKDLAGELTSAVDTYEHPDGPKAGLINATTAMLVDFGVPADKAPASAVVIADAVELAAGGQTGPGDAVNAIEQELINHGVNLPPYVGLLLAGALSQLLSMLQAKLHPPAPTPGK